VNSEFCCPRVLAWMEDTLRAAPVDRRPSFHSRYRSLRFEAQECRSPLEQLADSQGKRPRRWVERMGDVVMTIQFDLPTILVARSASVSDMEDPFRRLPAAGLKLFRARIETSSGDRKDTSYGSSTGSTSPTGECFWGTGSRPSVITGGMFFDRGSSLVAHCEHRVLGIEVELGFWTIEQHPHWN